VGRGPHRRRIAKGIYEDRSAVSVIWRSGGQPIERRFPLDTPLATLKRYREDQLRTATPAPSTPAGSLVRDIVRFLRFRRGRPSFKSDRAHLRPWAARFGRRSRFAITPSDCAQAVADWQLAGYSAQEIKHRVKIFRQLYYAFDGASARTPLDDVPMPRVPKPRPISPPEHVVRDVAIELRKHEILKRLRTAKTRARYLVLATTGIRPAQVKRAKPEDVDLEQRVWTVRPAKGDAGGTIYLNDDQFAAWALFFSARAWGPYDSRSFAKTLRRCGWPKGLRPYTLRHRIGLTLSELGVDLGDIQIHMGHGDPRTTRVYVPGVSERMRAVSAKLDGRMPLAALGPSPSSTTAHGRKRESAVKGSKSGGQSTAADHGAGTKNSKKSA
jgi:integrase